MGNINLKELISAVKGELPANKYSSWGFFRLAEKCATELEKALDKNKVLEEQVAYWQKRFKEKIYNNE